MISVINFPKTLTVKKVASGIKQRMILSCLSWEEPEILISVVLRDLINSGI